MTSRHEGVPGSDLFAEAFRHHQAGQLAEAEVLYRRLLATEPGHVTALYYLGVAVTQRGDHSLAEALLNRALVLAPNLVEAHNNLGIALQAQGRPEEAAASHKRALALKPDYAEAHYALGNAAMMLGQAGEALVSYRQAIALKPDYAEAHNNLGAALQSLGRLKESAASYRRALALKPDYAEAHNNLGAVLQARGRHEDSIAACREALALNPNYADAHYNLANALQAQGRLTEAAESYRRTLALQPTYAKAHNNLANTLKSQGRLHEAYSSFRRARQLEPENVSTHSNLLFSFQYDEAMTPGALLLKHRAYGERVARVPPPHSNARDPAKRLRIGYVSADLRQHPVGHFLAPVLARHDRTAFAAHCYYGHTQEDAMTAVLKSCADSWRSTAGMSDDHFFELIRADGIDILVDLAGHTAKNRLPVFARKPAPVQVTWAGYVGTTGLSAIDYLITDRWQSPPGSERYAVEQLMRLPDGYVCYAPPDYAPEVGPLPARIPGAVSFGSFNNMTKVNPRVIALWGELLRELPASRIVLKTRELGDPATRQRILSLFAVESIAAERVVLAGHSPHSELLKAYNDIDIALDPFPYSGGLTTIEALWMGVPVVTLGGDRFASRHSLSHLNVVGLGELVADGPESYLRIAQGLSRDLSRLAAMRAGLRARLSASPLLQSVRFTRALEAAFREMWKAWCGPDRQ